MIPQSNPDAPSGGRCLLSGYLEAARPSLIGYQKLPDDARLSLNNDLTRRKKIKEISIFNRAGSIATEYLAPRPPWLIPDSQVVVRR